MFFSLFFLSPVLSFAQENLKRNWNDEIIERANTGNKADHLSEDEKKVLLYMNLARIDGPRFKETVLDPYIHENDMKRNSYARSLQKELEKSESLSPLYPSGELFKIANNHAKKSGKTGHVGHKNFKDRYTPALENFKMVGENCDYGNQEPLDIVMSLLIDDGIKNLGHRKNIMNEKFTHVGISIQPHKKYKVNCVMSFGAM